jgi:YD repeat-containing protein
MTAIISGNSLGLSLTSRASLGQQGLLGQPTVGRHGEEVSVNVATGNLVLQGRDEVLMSHGQDVVALRTYNSLGLLNDDNGDNWSNGFYTQPLKLTGGAVNAAGSTLVRTDRDGAQASYTFTASPSPRYVNTDGAGAWDTITYDAGAGQYLWTDGQSGDTAVYRFSDGRLLSTADAMGTLTSYTYDAASGRLASVQSASGEAVYYEYSAGNLAQIRRVDTGGATSTRVRYAYDSSNRLKSVTLDLTPDDNAVADGNTYVTTYTYDGTSKRVASIGQADKTVLGITYDSSARVATLTDALGQVTGFAYDSANRTGTVTDALMRQTVYGYDSAGQLSRITAPAAGGASAVFTFEYSASGDLLRTVDGQDLAVDRAYDARGNLTQQRDALGNTVTRTYTGGNLLQTETVYLSPDPDGVGAALPGAPLTTRYVYSDTSAPLLRFVISPEGRVTEYGYNAYGERTARIEYPLGAFDVSALGQGAVPSEAQLQAWVDAQSPSATTRTDFIYDVRGQLQSSTAWDLVDASGVGVSNGKQSVTQYVYDPSGRLLKTVSPTLGTSQYTYDGLDRVLTSTDAKGQTTLSSYADDTTGSKTTITAANGLVSTSTYDKAGRLVSVQQSSASSANLGTTQYYYDALNQLAMVVDPTGVRRWSLYDEAGRQVADISAVGALTEKVYNQNNQLTREITYARPADTSKLVGSGNTPLIPSLASVRPAVHSTDRSTWYAYDSANLLSKTVDALGAVSENLYDGASRLVMVKRYANKLSTAALAVLGSAPEAGSLTPAPSSTDRITRRLYDGDGLLRGTLDEEGYLQEYRYNSAGQRVTQLAHAVRTDTAWWAAGSLEQLRPGVHSRNQTTSYILDSQGRTAGTVDPEGYFTESVFDASGNVTKTIRYVNKVTQTVTPTSSVAGLRPGAHSQDNATSWVYDGLNRVTKKTTNEGTVTSYAYDSAGNLTHQTAALGQLEARSLQYRYDLQGRLTGELSGQGAAQLSAGQSQAQIDALWKQHGLTHTYDAAGRRMSTVDQNNLKTLFYYNATGYLNYTINSLGEVSEARFNIFGLLATTSALGKRIGTAGLAGGLITAALTSAVNAARSSALDQSDTYTYDLTGRQASRVRAGAYNVTSAYNTFGERTDQSSYAGATVISRTVAAYDRRGLVTSTGANDFAAANPTLNKWDAFGRLIETSTSGFADKRTFAYDRLGRQVTVTDALLKATSTAYDAFDRVLRATDALGAVTTYTYDRGTRSVIVKTPEGLTLKTVHNRFGETAQATDANGNLTSYAYDKNGKLTSTTTALASSSSAYDNAGRLVQTTDAAGNTVQMAYDGANRLFTRTVDPDGLKLVTTYGYFVADDDAADAPGRLMTVTDPGGVTTRLIYGANGQLVQQIVDPTGLRLVTSYTYDGNGNTLSVRAPGGTLTTYSYDKLGRRIKEQTEPAGLNLTRLYAYDARDNLASRTDAEGGVTRYAYDLNGRLVYTLDPANGLEKHSYDAAGRLVQTRRFARPIDSAGLGAAPSVADLQAREVIDAADQIETRYYDKDGRLATRINGLGSVTRLTYDANGNVTRTTEYAQATDLSAPERQVVFDLYVATLGRNPESFEVIKGWTAYARKVGLEEVANAMYNSAEARGKYSPDIGAEEISAAKFVETLFLFTHDRDPNDKPYWEGRFTSAGGNVGRVILDLIAGQRRGSEGVKLDRHDTATISHRPSLAEVDALISAGAPSENRVTATVFDAANRAVFNIDAVGAVTRQAYDANGQVVERIAYAAPVAAGTAATLDAMALATGAIANSAQDQRIQQVWDTAGRRVFTIDALGAVTRQNYDANGNVVERIAYAAPVAAGTAATFMDLSMAVDAIADSAKDQRTQQAFDAAGRLVYSVDALGGVQKTSYDANGNVTSSTVYGRAAAYLASPHRQAVFDLYMAILDRNPESFETIRLAVETAGIVGLEQIANNLYNSVEARSKYPDTNDGSALLTTLFLLTHQRAPNQPASLENYWESRLQNARASNTEGQVILDFVTTQRRGFEGVKLDREDNRTIAHKPSVAEIDFVVNSATDAERSQDRTTRLFADAAGRPRFTVDAEGHITETRYLPGKTITTGYAQKPAGAIAANAVTADLASAVAALAGDANNRSSEQRTDAAGRVYESVDALGVVTHRDFDALGRLASETQAWGRPEQTRTRYTYNANGQALSRTVADGTSASATTRYGYDALGNLTSQVDPNAVANPQLLSAYTTTHAYNRAGKLISTTNGLGASTTTDYDAFGHAVKVTDPLGNAGYFYYDQLGRVSLQVDPEGYATQTGYWPGQSAQIASVQRFATRVAAGTTAAVRPALSMSSKDGLTVYTYDRLGRVLTTAERITERVGAGNALATESVQYSDASGNRFNKIATNKLGGKATFTTDKLGRTLSETLPDGAVTRYAYDAFGHRVQTTEASGQLEQRITSYRYDKAGRMTHRIGQAFPALNASSGDTSSVVPVEHTVYDALGRAIEVRKAAAWNAATGTVSGGSRTLSYFDAQGRQVALLAADGALTVYTLDAAGHRLVEAAYATPLDVLSASAGGAPPAVQADSANNANDRITTYVYDAVGRQTRASRENVMYWEPGSQAELTLASSLGTVVLQETAYDAAGNVRQTTDGRGNVVHTVYDKLGRLTARMDQEGYVTEWAYGDFQSIATRETRRGVVESQRLAGVTGTEPDRITEYVLDSTGHVLEKRVKGVAFEYTNASGALQSGKEDAVTWFTVDGLGHITQMRERVAKLADGSNVWNTTDISYDNMGREIKRQSPGFTGFQGTTVRPTTTTEYNGLGAVSRTLQRGANPDNAVETDDRITRYQYNVNGDRTSLEDAERNVTSYELDAQGRVARATLVGVKNADSGSTGGTTTNIVTSYLYDAMGRQVQTTDAGTGEVRQTKYNVFGEITGQSLGAGGKQEFIEYNTLGRVQRSNTGDGVAKIYLYDRNGNATRQIRWFLPEEKAQPGSTPAPQEGPPEDLKTMSVAKAAEDNRLAHTFSVYDRKNQLVKTVEPDISFQQDSISIQQAFTQQLAALYGGIALTNAVGGVYASGNVAGYQASSAASAGNAGLLDNSNRPEISSIAGIRGDAGAWKTLDPIATFGMPSSITLGEPPVSSEYPMWNGDIASLRDAPTITLKLPDDGVLNYEYRLIARESVSAFVYSDSYNEAAYTIIRERGAVVATGFSGASVTFRIPLTPAYPAYPDYPVGDHPSDYILQFRPKSDVVAWESIASVKAAMKCDLLWDNGIFTITKSIEVQNHKKIFFPSFSGPSGNASSYYIVVNEGLTGHKTFSPTALGSTGVNSIDVSALAEGNYSLLIWAFNANGQVIGGESSTLTINNGATISGKTTRSFPDLHAGGSTLYLDKFVATGSDAKTLYLRPKDTWGSYTARNASSGQADLSGLAGNTTYDFIIVTSGTGAAEWAGQLTLDGNGAITLLNNSMLQKMEGRVIEEATRGQKVTLLLNGTIRDYDDEPSHYFVDFSYSTPNGSWVAAARRNLGEGVTVTLGVDTDLAAVGASAFVASSSNYAYAVYKKHGDAAELVGRGDGTLNLGAARPVATYIEQQFMHVPKAVLQLPAGTAAPGDITLTTGGEVVVLKAGDWRRSLDSATGSLSLDLSQWIPASGSRAFSARFGAGLEQYAATLTLSNLGQVSCSELTQTSPGLSVKLAIAGDVPVASFTITTGPVGATTLTAAEAASRITTSAANTFVWDASAHQTPGSATTLRYYYTAYSAGNDPLAKGYGTLTFNANGTMTVTPDPALLKPTVVSFRFPTGTSLGTVTVYAKGTLQVVRTFTTTGRTIDASFSSLRPAAGAPDKDYDYTFEAKNSAGAILSKGQGSVTIASSGASSTTAPVLARQPTKIELQGPPGANIPKLGFEYREVYLNGSTALTWQAPAEAITGVWNSTLKQTFFSWDASAIAPQKTTDDNKTYEYRLAMQNADGTPFKNRVGDPITAQGQMVLGGNIGAPLSFKQYVKKLDVSAQVRRAQTWNAFGEVVSEYDDRVEERMDAMLKYYQELPDYALDLGVKNAAASAADDATVRSTYNALGQLIRKVDPQAWRTSETGAHSRFAPVTEYGYDLLGRLNTSTDANGHQQRQRFVGAGTGQMAAQWTAQQKDIWSANGGKTLFSYDIFGDAVRQVNELDAVTDQTYNKLGQLTGVSRAASRMQADDSTLTSTLTDTYTYDMRGQRLTHTDALGQTSRSYYDSLGRVSKTIGPTLLGVAGSPEGALVSYSYTFVAQGTADGILSVGGASLGGYQRRTTGADGRSVIDNIDYFGRTTWHQDQYQDAQGRKRQYVYSYNLAGLLTSQQSWLGGASLQNIQYSYYANGFIKQAKDLASQTLSRYGYDNAGNRTWESYSGLALDGNGPKGSYQNVAITYDELNRMAHIKDLSVDVQYEYDAVGNRRAVHATYFDPLTAGFRKRDDMWYTYDAADRFTLTKGSLTAQGQIVQGSQGVAIGYNKAGQRTSAVNADGSGETYTYSTDGYLEDTSIGGILRARRRLDALGRTVDYSEFEANGTTLRRHDANTYHADNRLSSSTSSAGSAQGITRYYYFNAGDTSSARTGKGQLAATRFTAAGSSAITSTTAYTYAYWDEAKQASITAWQEGIGSSVSSMAYDANGFLQQVSDTAAGSATPTRTLTYTNSATGLVMRRDEKAEGNPDGNALTDDTYQHFYYYAAGRRIGDITTDPNDNYRKSYAEELAISLKDLPTNQARFKNFAPVTSADFDQNYEPINSNYPGAAATSYTVRANDTLSSIAQSLWGDAGMWYLLAEANALKGTDALAAGRVLIVPNKVTNIHNNANTFRPYNAGEMIGKVDPTLPTPPPPADKGGCGGLGQVLMIVVAVVATIYTAGAAAAAGALGTSAAASAAAVSGVAVGAGASTLGATFAAGAAVMGGSAGLAAAVAASVVGAAVGSAASQLTGMVTGNVSSFSWKAVGQSALGAGITAGVGSALSLSPASVVGSGGWSSSESLLRGAALSATSTGVNMVLHGSWSWRQVGASLVGAAAGAGAGLAAGSAMTAAGLEQSSQFAQRLASGYAGGWASSEVMAGNSRFSRADSSVLFASAFGNAVGSSIAEGGFNGASQQGDTLSQAAQGQGPWSDMNYRNGLDADSDRVTNLNGFLDAFSGDASGNRYPGEQIAGAGDKLRLNPVRSDAEDLDGQLADAQAMQRSLDRRDAARANAVGLLVNPATGLADFKYTSHVANAVNESLDQAFGGGTDAGTVASILKGVVYGAGKAAFEMIAPVADLLQAGNELGRSWITGEAPRDISFISSLGKMAGQGATTGDIFNGGMMSLLTTPDRIAHAYQRADYSLLGEELGGLGFNAALAGAGLRGSIPSLKMGVQLAAEDLGASSLGQRVGAAMEGYQYRMGNLSYAAEPGSSGINAVIGQPRTVSFQRSDLSVTLNAHSREGVVLVNAAGETHTVGLISIVDNSPQFYLDNKVVTSTGESIKLKLEGGSLTQAALEDTISAYKASYGNAPPALSGSLADKNLLNFKNEFSQLRSKNFVLTDQVIGDLAVRNISFGANRIKIGYGGLTTQMGNFNSLGVPTNVSVRATPYP